MGVRRYTEHSSDDANHCAGCSDFWWPAVHDMWSELHSPAQTVDRMVDTQLNTLQRRSIPRSLAFLSATMSPSMHWPKCRSSSPTLELSNSTETFGRSLRIEDLVR